MREKSEKNVRETTLADTKANEEAEGGGITGIREQRFPCFIPFHGEELVGEGCPLKPMEYHVGADVHTAVHGGPHARAGGCVLKEAASHGDPT